VKSSLNFIAILVLVWGCANRVQPTGGPKDEDPPKLVHSVPESGQRNFKGQEIFVEFDEYVTTKSLNEQLIITPRIDGDYEYKIRKRVVHLTFSEPFDDSTTYTLNFREGIVDIHESLPAEDLLLAFSTGNMLDTLEISGTVIDLLTKKLLDKVTVGLYPIDDTLDIFSGAPYYFTKTNGQGNYTFTNVKSGEYRIYAFDDQNKNLTCESNREAYAFLDQTIKLDTVYFADTMNMQFLNIDTLEITRTRLSGRYFLLTANKYLTQARIISSDTNVIQFKFADDHKGLKIYNTFPIQDSLKVWAIVQDSLGLSVQDTFYLKFPESSRKADEFKLSIKDPEGSLAKKIILGEITFDKPLSQFNPDSISIKKDSLAQYFVSDTFSYQIDSLENKLSYTFKIPQAILDSLNKKSDKLKSPKDRGSLKGPGKLAYKLVLPKATFISIENDSSKTLSKQIKFTNNAKTGLITGKITTLYKSFFIQLLNDKFDIVKEQYNGDTFTFTEIPPGNYYIRIMIDENGNGKWDMADIRLNRPAEKVILYRDSEGNSNTVIRANWEITIDLSF
jgi:uncharacterized protein (DUF2141 family)